jgi:hypothetical protein
MTCFWDAILASLNKEISISHFINKLKEKNCFTDNITWNNEFLSKKLQEENMTAIKNFDITNIHNGHLTSSCDYFLCLLCEILKININHNYINNKISYQNIKENRKTLLFGSNTGHFFKL